MSGDLCHAIRGPDVAPTLDIPVGDRWVTHAQQPDAGLTPEW
jgi:hypothetical protein